MNRNSSNNEYYRHQRREMMPFLPLQFDRVLELGCGEGAFGAAVKDQCNAEVWGIEIHSDAAAIASGVLDKVIVGDLEPSIESLPESYFDVLVCNDVLEHLVDPVEILSQLRSKLKPGGVVVASIPNIRFIPAILTIVVRKDFPSEDAGIFDRTHLHFFTRKSIVRMFDSAGFEVNRLKGINRPRRRDFPAVALTLALTFGFFADGLFTQYACVATPKESP